MDLKYLVDEHGVAVIPAGMTEIGYMAFFDCENLTIAVVPEGVTKIGNSAFSGCSALEEVHTNKPELLKDVELSENVKILEKK